MRVAPAVTLTDAQRQELTALSRRRTVQVRVAQRARIVLHAAEGWQGKLTQKVNEHLLRNIVRQIMIVSETKGLREDPFAMPTIKSGERLLPLRTTFVGDGNELFVAGLLAHGLIVTRLRSEQGSRRSSWQATSSPGAVCVGDFE